MLPLLALTYTAARLGFEAQSAAAFRLLRLGRGNRAARRYCYSTGIGRAETAPRREEDSQKIGASSEAQQGG